MDLPTPSSGSLTASSTKTQADIHFREQGLGECVELAEPHAHHLNARPFRRLPPGAPICEVEVAIVGAGIVGLTASRLLKRSGKTVAVIEMDRLVRGVTGYTTARITAGHGLIYQQLERKHGEEAARAYAMANQGAFEKMSGWIEEAIACDFERRPNLVYTERNESKSSI